MQLIGVNRSPFTRRVALTLRIYGMPYEQNALSGFRDRDAVRSANPLGRIPALVLDDGETLVDSHAIIDHLDEIYGRERALTPASGADRRLVLKLVAILMGACDKALQVAYERNYRPVETVHQPWIDDCMAQVASALTVVDTMITPEADGLVLGRLTQADLAAFVTERLARGLGLDTERDMPNLFALTSRLGNTPPFASTEPWA